MSNRTSSTGKRWHLKSRVSAIAATAALLAAPASGASSGEAEACRKLKVIVAHADNDFSAITGAKLNELDYVALQPLPNQQGCSIQRTKRVSLECKSPTLPSKEAADRLAAKTLEEARKCLGTTWTPQTTLSEFFTALNDEEHARSLIIKVEQENPLGEHIVRTSVARARQEAIEKPAMTPAVARPQEYCKMLKSVIASGASHFNEIIRGAAARKAGNRSHWLAGIQLAGWQDCWVHEEGGHEKCRYYSCKTGPVADQKEAQELITAVTNDVAGCLGNGWAAGKVRQTDGSISSRIMGVEEAYVELRPSQSIYSTGWNVHIDVSLDLESCN